MSRSLLSATIAACALVAFVEAAAAQTTAPMPMSTNMMHMMSMHMPQQITVVATGTVTYVPDIVRVNVGIRAESPSAASAIDTINKNSAQVISAVKALGINAGSIKTVGYNLSYREPAPPVAQTAVSASAATAGQYVASEMLEVTSPVSLAGKVLDAAIGAGANESFGLNYQSSNADSLYRKALANAVQSARQSADAIAAAAHLTITGIQSITNASEAQGGIAPMQAAFRSSASLLPGTDAVTATVSVVYQVK